jgi:alpha-D-ribose 1-methylphosphonate 5-triphosphate synthase subunit PhnH
MARPGSVGTVDRHEHGGDYAPAISMLEALLDHEVSFAVLPDRADLIELILRQTGSHLVALEDAGYILCDAASLPEVLSRARTGDLEYPDRNATVICLVDYVSGEPGRGQQVTLAGPGVNVTTSVWVEPFEGDMLAALQETNAQPPLGVDLILVGPDGRFTCLNRYTKVREVQ